MTFFREKKLLELSLLFASLLLITYITLILPQPLFYLFIPFALWAPFRFGEKVSMVTGCFIAALIIFQALFHLGPFKFFPNVNDALIVVQSFVGVVFIILLSVQTVLNQRKQTHNALLLSHASLQKSLEDQNRAIAHKNNQLANIIFKMRDTEKLLSLMLMLIESKNSQKLRHKR